MTPSTEQEEEGFPTHDRTSDISTGIVSLDKRIREHVQVPVRFEKPDVRGPGAGAACASSAPRENSPLSKPHNTSNRIIFRRKQVPTDDIKFLSNVKTCSRPPSGNPRAILSLRYEGRYSGSGNRIQNVFEKRAGLNPPPSSDRPRDFRSRTCHSVQSNDRSRRNPRIEHTKDRIPSSLTA